MRDALTRQQEMSNVVASLERMVKELRLSVELANTRYDNGYSSYLEVLERGTLVVRQRNAARRRAQRTPVVHRECLPRAWRRLEVA